MLHYGKVEDGKIEYVKGHDYEVASFLGDVEMTQRVRALHSQSAAPFFSCCSGFRRREHRNLPR